MNPGTADGIVRLALWLRSYDKTSSDVVIAAAANMLFRSAARLHRVCLHLSNGTWTKDSSDNWVDSVDGSVRTALAMLNVPFTFEHCLDPRGQAPYVIFRPVRCRRQDLPSRFGIKLL